MFTVNQLAERYHVTPETIRIRIRTGKLKALKIKGTSKLLIDEEEVKRYENQ